MFTVYVSSDREDVKMKYIEIDGERIEVHGCRDCPCYDYGERSVYGGANTPRVAMCNTANGILSFLLQNISVDPRMIIHGRNAHLERLKE